MAEKIQFLSDVLEDLPYDEVGYVFTACTVGHECTAEDQIFIIKKFGPVFFAKDDFWCQIVIQRLSDEKYFQTVFCPDKGFELVDIDEFEGVAYVSFTECVPKQVVMTVFEAAE